MFRLFKSKSYPPQESRYQPLRTDYTGPWIALQTQDSLEGTRPEKTCPPSQANILARGLRQPPHRVTERQRSDEADAVIDPNIDPRLPPPCQVGLHRQPQVPTRHPLAPKPLTSAGHLTIHQGGKLAHLLRPIVRKVLNKHLPATVYKALELQRGTHNAAERNRWNRLTFAIERLAKLLEQECCPSGDDSAASQQASAASSSKLMRKSCSKAAVVESVIKYITDLHDRLDQQQAC
ncbi:hypothetical protein S40285_10230 [Stachybotrys chlorohalonatus IBT 40285]|uniref:BHLH domain-containing protein n=1 Tax=Stachybotrys chlorohalonatus (strain IBT 40285) TaxID=1283841 RepID=A0A084QZU0_STAC4|nr:hypothetical protein S40285_10230 [Stachybotrys chlorohalonata IBT 40285]